MLLKSSIFAILVAVATAAPCDAPHKDISPVPKCKASEFFFGPKSCCLPHGGPEKCSYPPPEKSCPYGGDWYWHTGKDCCVPYVPNPPEPKCDDGWGWNKDSYCCERHGGDYDWPIKPLPKPAKKPTPTTVSVDAAPSSVSQCNTGGVHCCNQVQKSDSSDATKLLDLWGVKLHNSGTGNNQTNVGINCSPDSGIGANCAEQPVCCEDNHFKGGDGAIVVGCSPINIVSA